MSQVTFAISHAAEPWVDGLVRAFGSVFGEGHVHCLQFTVDGDRTSDWLLEHTLEGTRFDLGPLLLSGRFAEAAPDLATGVNPDRMACFEHLSAFELGGE